MGKITVHNYTYDVVLYINSLGWHGRLYSSIRRDVFDNHKIIRLIAQPIPYNRISVEYQIDYTGIYRYIDGKRDFHLELS